MSKKWKASKIAKGLCGSCGKEPLVTMTLCFGCSQTKRLRERRKAGCSPWEQGKAGRPPKYADCLTTEEERLIKTMGHLISDKEQEKMYGS